MQSKYFHLKFSLILKFYFDGNLNQEEIIEILKVSG